MRLHGAAEVASATRADPRPLTDREFTMLADFIHAEIGIYLNSSKKALMEGRLSKRLRELGLSSFEAYHRRVTREDPDERVVLFDRISTNETHFFREPAHFEFLAEHVLPVIAAEAEAGKRSRTIRVWSAASSTGEEAYSLAMLMYDQFPRGQGWSLQIIGTDISTSVLARARAAVWPLRAAEEIPAAFRKRFMLRGVASQADRMKASPELRATVTFERLNLIEDDYAVAGAPFDIIFCRNVLIYFDAANKHRVCQRMVEALAPGGHLFLGHAESLHALPVGARRVRASVYTRVSPSIHPAA
jgi:chemotaxis protein methyltransferase CheR